MTTQDDLIDYGKKHGWLIAHNCPEMILLRTERHGIVVWFSDTGHVDRCRTYTGRLTGGVPAVKQYLRENGDA